MVWQQTFYTVWSVIGMLGYVVMIGRDPITPGVAVLAILIQAGLVVLVRSI